ncbi:lipase family protein [Gordonia sp. NPDC003429]
MSKAAEQVAPEGEVTQRKPVLPVDDPFYEAPDDLGALRPGEIIRSRQVVLKNFWVSHHRAWQLLYRTSDLNGMPDVTVTTVVIPDGHTTEHPLLSFQGAIDAVTSQCFPSYALQKGAEASRSVAPFEFMVVRRALAKGWAVSIPDHEGLKGAWGAPREPGYRALDGVRATLAFEPLDLRADTQIGLWGYSGGGMASSWAAEMAPTYAPELNIVGAVLGSPVGDMAEALLRLNGGFHAGLPILVIAGLQRVYPGLKKVIDKYATERGRKYLAEAVDLPTGDAIRRFRNHDLDDYLSAPLADVLAEPEMVEMMRDVQLGTHNPGVPLLVIQAIHDEVIAAADVDEQVAKYREHGVPVTYVRDLVAEHYSLLALSGPLAVSWLSHRFEGRPARDRTVAAVAGQPRPKLRLNPFG